MSFLYHTFFFDPLYNTLILLFRIFPWADAGVIVIMLTTLVRLVLYPLSKKAVLTQLRMQEIAPEIDELKSKHKDKPEELARATLALYRKKKVNPFSGILVVLIQLPLIFALYRIFLHFSEVRTDLLYSFVPAPGEFNTLFLGLLDIADKSILLALLAALTTYYQLKISTQGQKPSKGDSLGENLAKSMQTQMKYFFPIVIFFISYTLPSVISLYFIATNIFSVIQEVVIKKTTFTNLKAS